MKNQFQIKEKLSKRQKKPAKEKSCDKSLKKLTKNSPEVQKNNFTLAKHYQIVQTSKRSPQVREKWQKVDISNAQMNQKVRKRLEASNS